MKGEDEGILGDEEIFLLGRELLGFWSAVVGSPENLVTTDVAGGEINGLLDVEILHASA